MKFIRHFEEINKDDLAIAGGKGANLGELHTKMPIPPGFVLTAQAYEEFLNPIKAEIGELLKDLDVENSAKLNAVSKKVQEHILQQKFPDEMRTEVLEAYSKIRGFVAVRSSATMEDLPSASFAGQQATFLNIKGNDQLVEAVQKCWASLFTSRAIYYRQTKGFDHMKAAIAVVVQKMVDARAAGVAFSVNPINGNKNDIVIEASFGLGEAVVSGQVTPDLYIVHKDALKIHQKTINEQTWGYYRGEAGTIKRDVANPKEQVLSDEELVQIGKLVKQIEDHYGTPQDIEWAVDENGKLYLLQARPITTLA